MYQRYSSNFVTLIPQSYYKESERILGNTLGMLVLQDFEAITPNLLARAIETVEGGGLVDTCELKAPGHVEQSNRPGSPWKE